MSAQKHDCMKMKYLMNLISLADYAAISTYVAELISQHVRENPEATLGLATGSTPLGMYQSLIDDHKNNATSYAGVSTYNLDEYVGLDATHPQSYASFMRKHFFDSIDIDLSNTHIPSGDAPDLAHECLRYEQLLAHIGGVDIQILGIGANGHIGFNEPGASFSAEVNVTDLAPKTRDHNARFFGAGESVPNQAVTMGIGTILRAKKIILMASGEGKAEAMHALLDGPVTEEIPATALRSHSDVIIVADQDALSARRSWIV